MNVTITLSDRDWRALLAELPHCGCGALAEIEFNGRRACVSCVAAMPRQRARCRTLDHADAVGAIVDALSPHTAAGSWENE